MLRFHASPALSARYRALTTAVAPGARSVDRSQRDLAPAGWIRGPRLRSLPPASSTAALDRSRTEQARGYVSVAHVPVRTVEWDRSYGLDLDRGDYS